MIKGDKRMQAAIIDCFSELTDPRLDRKKRHKLIDIVTITICAVICAADDWVAIESFGKSKIEWFKQFLELPNGIPSHDTFGRVFSLISPTEFQNCFKNWINAIAQVSDNQIIPIDGKTLRHSYDRSSNKSAIHMVSAWTSKNKVVIGQIKTDEKSNEITAIPKLLKALEIKGCIVTIDAMGCQKKIVEQIIDQKGDYVIGLKGNQGKLLEEVTKILDEDNENEFETSTFDYFKTEEVNHGRTEVRRYYTTDAIDNLSNKKEWKGLNIVGVVESERQIKEEKSIDYRYYIGSIENDAKRFAEAVRGHWGVENSVHWILDIAFREDESRIRQGNAPENLAVIRHIALNLLKQEKSAKMGVKNKRLKSGWDEEYLAKVLFNS